MYDIEIENLSIYYDEICALNDVNIKVKKGEFLGIVGPNGGGKTTLLKSILGIIEPSKGKIKINNSKKIGYVPQYNAFDK